MACFESPGFRPPFVIATSPDLIAYGACTNPEGELVPVVARLVVV